MTSPTHTPVLSEEVVRFLQPAPGSWILDCTVNGGGHAALMAGQGARVLGLEWDPVIAAAFGTRHPELADSVTVVHASYTELERVCREQGVVPDGILFDLGLSSLHYESSGRGFSFMRPEEPLDMRYDPTEERQTAADILNEATEAELEHLFTTYGEEQFAGRVAAAITTVRRTAPFRTVGELVAAIEGAVPAWYRHRKLHCATKSFQALRVMVNNELDNVTAGLEASLRVLRPGGRLAVISFQGSEDKIVRELFKREAAAGHIKWVTRDTIRPTWAETRRNPRSRSAKMKIVEKI